MGKVRTRSSRRQRGRPPKRASTRVTEDLRCNAVPLTTWTDRNKYKSILGSKELYVVLSDCLSRGNSLGGGVPAVVNESGKGKRKYKLSRGLVANPGGQRGRKRRLLKKTIWGGMLLENQSEKLVRTDSIVCNIEYRKSNSVESVGEGLDSNELGDGVTLEGYKNRDARYDNNLNLICGMNDSESMHRLVTKDLDRISPLPKEEQQIVQCVTSKDDDFAGKETNLENTNNSESNNGQNNDYEQHIAAKEVVELDSDCLKNAQDKDNLIIDIQNIDSPHEIDSNVDNQRPKSVTILSSTPLAEYIVGKSSDKEYCVTKNAGTVVDRCNTSTKRIKLSRIYSGRNDKTIRRKLNANDNETEVAAFAKTSIDQTMDAQCRNDDSVLNTGQQGEIRNVKDTVEHDCDPQRRTVQSEAVTSTVNALPEKSYKSLEDKINYAEDKIVDDESEQSDCISLFADTNLMEEYDISILDKSSRKETQYHMADDVFKNYYERTAYEFREMFSTPTKTEPNTSVPKKRKSNWRQSERIAAKESKWLKQPPAVVQELNAKPATAHTRVFSYFIGYCYKTIRTGVPCSRARCPYNHEFASRIVQLYLSNEDHLFGILDQLVAETCTAWLKNSYNNLVMEVHRFRKLEGVVKILKKFYDLKIASDKDAYYTVEYLQRNGSSISVIVDTLAEIVNDHDFEFINWISCKLMKYVARGKYWDTLRSLLRKTETLEPKIVRAILQESRLAQRFILDVHINIMQKTYSTTNARIKASLLPSLESLIRDESRGSRMGENSSELNKCAGGTPIEVGKEEDDGLSAQNKRSGFTLIPIDHLPKPRSALGRHRFWKFYVDVYSLQKGFKYRDYDHVSHILTSARKHPQSFFTRACYRILRKCVRSLQR